MFDETKSKSGEGGHQLKKAETRRSGSASEFKRRER